LARLDADGPPADPLAALPAGADRLVHDLREAGLDAGEIAAETGLPAEAVKRLLSEGDTG
jgi:DNA-directed RNA polymerase specialized sigma24 family protein